MMRIVLSERAKENIVGGCALLVCLIYGFIALGATGLVYWLVERVFDSILGALWSSIVSATCATIVLIAAIILWPLLIYLFILYDQRDAMREAEEARCLDAEMEGRW